MDLRHGDPRRIGHGRPSIEVHVEHRDQRHGEVDTPLLDVCDELAYDLAALGHELGVVSLDSGQVVVRVPPDEVDRNAAESLADVDHACLLAHAVTLPMLVFVALEDDDLVAKVVHAVRALAAARERSIDGDVGGCSREVHRVQVVHERGLLGEAGHAEGLRVAALALVVPVEDVDRPQLVRGLSTRFLSFSALCFSQCLGTWLTPHRAGFLQCEHLAVGRRIMPDVR